MMKKFTSMSFAFVAIQISVKKNEFASSTKFSTFIQKPCGPFFCLWKGVMAWDSKLHFKSPVYLTKPLLLLVFATGFSQIRVFANPH